MKTISLVLIGILVLGIIVGGYFIDKQFKEVKMGDEKEEQPRLYQGPVPEGYDEDYFRKTGITKPLPLEE